MVVKPYLRRVREDNTMNTNITVAALDALEQGQGQGQKWHLRSSFDALRRPGSLLWRRFRKSSL